MMGYSKVLLLVFMIQKILIYCTLINDRHEIAYAGLTLSSNITCNILGGDHGEKLVLAQNQKNNVYLHQNLNVSILCELKTEENDSFIPGNLSFKIANSNGTREWGAQFLNYSNGAYHAILHLAPKMLNIKEKNILPFILDVVSPHSTILLAKGNISMTSILSTSVKVSGDVTTRLSLNESNRKWEFLPVACDIEKVLILQEELDNKTTAIEIGTAVGTENLTLLKWEYISTSFKWNSTKYQKIHTNNFLLFYSTEDLVLIPSIQGQLYGNASRNIKSEILRRSEISAILAVSATSNCIEGYQSEWYDMAVIFRLHNSSIKAMLGLYPYQTWDLYTFPDWFNQAQDVTSQLDVGTRTLVVLASIGEPLSTMASIFKINKDTKDLVLQSVPFALRPILNAPHLKKIPFIQVFLAYDKSSVWISIDDGRSFQQIFMVRKEDEVQDVRSTGTLMQNLVIICKYRVYTFSSREILESNDYPNACSASSSILLRTSTAGTIDLYCNIPTINATISPITLDFTVLEVEKPSFVAEMLDYSKLSIRLPFIFKEISRFQQYLKRICLISKFPHVHMCDNIDTSGVPSLQMQLNSVIRVDPFEDCFVQLSKVDSTKYLIRALSTKSNPTYASFSANIIGKSLQMPSMQVVCWVYWLRNTTALEAVCSNDQSIGDSVILESSKVAWIDSRGSERCFEATVTLTTTTVNSVNTLQPSFANPDDATSLQNATYIRLSETVAKISHNGSFYFAELLTEAGKLQYQYICIINKNFPKNNLTNKLQQSAQTCLFNASSEGIVQPELFLDAGDEVRFNITLQKLSLQVSYKDSISPFFIQLSSQEHITLKIRTSMKGLIRQIRVFLKQKHRSKGTTIIKMQSPVQPAHCNNLIPNMVIHGTCPPHKEIIFKYPNEYSREVWLSGDPEDENGIKHIATLPFNYQPPSHRGKAIPMTSHIYNADPSKRMHRARYKVTRDLAKFKQCRGKLNRLECGCTDDMKLSSFPSHSDCIQRVYSIDYTQLFKPDVYVVYANGSETILSFPYTVTEINNRSDYLILNNLGPNLMSMPAQSEIAFKGSGLFHFRIDVVKSGYTFCDLTAYFIFFVSDEPFPEPTQDLVRAMTSFCFASVLLSLFLYNYYSPNKK